MPTNRTRVDASTRTRKRQRGDHDNTSVGQRSARGSLFPRRMRRRPPRCARGITPAAAPRRGPRTALAVLAARSDDAIGARDNGRTITD